MNKDKMKEMIGSTITSLQWCGRFDAIAKLTDMFGQLFDQKDEDITSPFDVLDYCVDWEGAPEGKEYWRGVYESLAFDTSKPFRKLVDDLMEDKDFEDGAWHLLEKKRVELDSADKDLGTKVSLFNDAVKITVDGDVDFETEDEMWGDVLFSNEDSVLLDRGERVEFQPLFRAEKGDAKAMHAKAGKKPDKNWKFIASVDGEMELPDEDPEETDKPTNVKYQGKWSLWINDRKTRRGSPELHATYKRTGAAKTIQCHATSSLNEALNRMFTGQKDMFTEAIRYAMLHGMLALTPNVMLTKKAKEASA